MFADERFSYDSPRPPRRHIQRSHIRVAVSHAAHCPSRGCCRATPPRVRAWCPLDGNQQQPSPVALAIFPIWYSGQCSLQPGASTCLATPHRAPFKFLPCRTRTTSIGCDRGTERRRQRHQANGSPGRPNAGYPNASQRRWQCSPRFKPARKRLAVS